MGTIYLTPTDDEGTQKNRMEDSISRRSDVSEMGFHICRVDGSGRQDIITLGDIRDKQSESPSWSKLLGILRDEQSIGIKKGSECPTANGRTRVANQR